MKSALMEPCSLSLLVGKSVPSAENKYHRLKSGKGEHNFVLIDEQGFSYWHWKNYKCSVCGKKIIKPVRKENEPEH